MPRRPELYRKAMLDLYCDSFPIATSPWISTRASIGASRNCASSTPTTMTFCRSTSSTPAAGWPCPCCGRRRRRAILTLVKRVVSHLRERFPRVRIRLRGDSHYACPEVMSWCEARGIEYIFGLAGTAPLAAQVQTLEARTAARYAARPSHPSSSSAATRTSRAGPSRGNASAGSGRSRTRRGRHPLHRHQSDRPPGAAALRAEILPERENLLKSFTWPPIGPPARELAPTRSGSFCMAPPIGCSGRSRASCRSARPGASSTPSGTG